ncbi:carbonic anhydrase 4 [Pseudonaja textilis]|uniref:carbonic anhydrase 4 n=1 Tax=Pseudonaja textilis TaxID=8673 RepID=UPI000EA87269|nr:carbonic anhydrase 4 [Pseudonaja textilis]
MRGLPGLVFLLGCSAFAAAASEEGKNWCYASQLCKVPDCKEPRLWAKVDSECGNDKQSPINILTRQVTYNESLKAFNFINYNVKSNGKWTMENNGHTVIVQLDPSGKVELGGLNGRYKVVQFHFHWGSEVGKTQSPGSEHSIDGERYPMELHIVHIKEEFGNIESASEEKGVAVLGFFIKAGKTNPNYEPLISNLEKIGAKGGKVDIPALALESLIPDKKDLTNFYRYTGSLTTPGCNEEVVWTLFEKPIELGGEQIQKFWEKVYFDSEKKLPMVDNFRPVQPLGARIVEKSNSNLLLPLRKALLLVPTAALLAFAWIS